MDHELLRKRGLGRAGWVRSWPARPSQAEVRPPSILTPARNPGIRVPKPCTLPGPLKIKGAKSAILGPRIANFAPLILPAPTFHDPCREIGDFATAEPLSSRHEVRTAPEARARAFRLGPILVGSPSQAEERPPSMPGQRRWSIRRHDTARCRQIDHRLGRSEQIDPGPWCSRCGSTTGYSGAGGGSTTVFGARGADRPPSWSAGCGSTTVIGCPGADRPPSRSGGSVAGGDRHVAEVDVAGC
jgi:hypothetical protein